MKTIKIYCGEDICGNVKIDGYGYVCEFHPVYQFERAKRVIKDFNELNEERLIYYSNSPDFVSSLYYMAEKQNIPCEVYLNNKLSTFEDVFSDWNRFYDLLDGELE